MSVTLDDEWSNNEEDEEDDGDDSDFVMEEEEEEEEEDEEEEEEEEDNDNDTLSSKSKDTNQQITSSSYNTSVADIMMEITSILQEQSEVSFGNALTLNKEMQRRLNEVRERIQSLLVTVQVRMKMNEKRLQESVKTARRGGIGMRGAYLNGGTFYFKGNMFFKDLNCRNCPNNPDYEYRKNTEREMFPMDFELRGRHIWSLVDKVSIVQAIKEQVIDHMNDQKKRQKTRLEIIKKNISLHSGKLVHLLNEVDDKFCIDWEQIAAHNVRKRHTPFTCEAMWMVYLQPVLKRNAWSEDENRRLVEAADAHNFQDWVAIAEAVGKRSDYQCFVQYQTSACFQQRKRYPKWNKQDDERLLQLIEKNTANGIINWSCVCAHFPHKPKAAIQGRYMYSVNPQISHEPFTPDEDLLLLAAVQEYGTRFATFPRTLFPNRSIVQLRSRYFITLQNRHKLKPWSAEDDKKLMEYVAENGTSSWQQCAVIMDNHTRISCRTRFLTIQKFFAKNPNAAIEDLPRRFERFVDSSITVENWGEKIAELRENPKANFKREILRKRKSRAAANLAEPKPKKMKTTTPKLQLKKVKKVKKEKKIPKEPKKSKKPPKVTGRRKSLYTDRLRQVGIKLYNFFKYSYNFRLGEDPCTKWPSTFASLRVVMNALDFNMPMAEHFVHDANLPVTVRHKVKALLMRQPSVQMCPIGYRLPPSWSTAMAFRALCVRAAQVDSVKTESRREATEKSEAVQLFRQRLRSLLYKTALLSRLGPRTIVNKHGCMEPLPLTIVPMIEDDDGLQHVHVQLQNVRDFKQEFSPEIINESHFSQGEIQYVKFIKQLNIDDERKLKCPRPQEDVANEKRPRLVCSVGQDNSTNDPHIECIKTEIEM